jgi:hypothetical protein
VVKNKKKRPQKGRAAWFPSRREDSHRSTFNFQADGLVAARPRWDLCGEKRKTGFDYRDRRFRGRTQ